MSRAGDQSVRMQLLAAALIAHANASISPINRGFLVKNGTRLPQALQDQVKGLKVWADPIDDIRDHLPAGFSLYTTDTVIDDIRDDRSNQMCNGRMFYQRERTDEFFRGVVGPFDGLSAQQREQLVRPLEVLFQSGFKLGNCGEMAGLAQVCAVQDTGSGAPAATMMALDDHAMVFLGDPAHPESAVVCDPWALTAFAMSDAAWRAHMAPMADKIKRGDQVIPVCMSVEGLVDPFERKAGRNEWRACLDGSTLQPMRQAQWITHMQDYRVLSPLAQHYLAHGRLPLAVDPKHYRLDKDFVCEMSALAVFHDDAVACRVLIRGGAMTRADCWQHLERAIELDRVGVQAVLIDHIRAGKPSAEVESFKEMLSCAAMTYESPPRLDACLARLALLLPALDWQKGNADGIGGEVDLSSDGFIFDDLSLMCCLHAKLFERDPGGFTPGIKRLRIQVIDSLVRQGCSDVVEAFYKASQKVAAKPVSAVAGGFFAHVHGDAHAQPLVGAAQAAVVVSGAGGGAGAVAGPQASAACEDEDMRDVSPSAAR